MRPATLTTCLLAAALVPAGSAAAAPKPKPKPTRHLIADARGDMRAVDGLDIVCGDVAFSRHEVVAVLTLADRPSAPLGGEWELGMTVNGVAVTFLLRESAAHVYQWAAQVGGTPVPLVGTVTPNTVVWRVPRRNVPALSKRTLKVTNAVARTTFGVTADEAATPGACF